MASHRPSARFAAPSFLLAIALVVGSAAPTIARDAASDSDGAFGGSAIRAIHPAAVAAASRPDATARASWRLAELTYRTEPAARPAPEVRPPVAVPVARPEVISKQTTSTGTGQSAASFKGRNHVWIPALGINRSVAGFACSSTAYPGNRVYRWGCAGRNNVYLFGHAHSVFKPLHDAYVSGRLRKGMAVYYAAADGVVHRYVVRWWKVTTPDKGAWAFAAQSRPSMTLQTCVGAKSQFRLVVRLVRAD
jgi:sortase (surface protein transpeptidase)